MAKKSSSGVIMAERPSFLKEYPRKFRITIQGVRPDDVADAVEPFGYPRVVTLDHTSHIVRGEHTESLPKTKIVGKGLVEGTRISHKLDQKGIEFDLEFIPPINWQKDQD